MNPLVKFTSDGTGPHGEPVYVSALHVAGIDIGNKHVTDEKPYTEYGAVIHFNGTSVTVRETVDEAYALFEAALKKS